MAQVQVTVNGRAYQIACDDGQEAHVARLGRYLDQRVTGIVKGLGQVGDQRLLVMAALMIADELVETGNALNAVRGDDTQAAREARANAVIAAPTQPVAVQPDVDPVNTEPLIGGVDERVVIEAIETLAQRVEGIAASLARD
ncbi:MAG TPA: cell division protein ZapA [Stellaceae bacterium]|nr:cell division protein ZapA [Stellaceae bacterium]